MWIWCTIEGESNQKHTFTEVLNDVSTSVSSAGRLKLYFYLSEDDSDVETFFISSVSICLWMNLPLIVYQSGTLFPNWNVFTYQIKTKF